VRSPCSLCVCESVPFKFLMPEPICMKICISVLAAEPLSGLLYESLLSIYVSVYVSLLSSLGKVSVKCMPPFIARKVIGKHVPAVTNTEQQEYCWTIVRMGLCVCIPLSLLSNNSAKTFPQQRRIVGSLVFYVVRVVSEESRRLVLPRTSCYLC
jgi:hypothetical protein